jgi:hypothetical protein
MTVSGDWDSDSSIRRHDLSVTGTPRRGTGVLTLAQISHRTWPGRPPESRKTTARVNAA